MPRHLWTILLSSAFTSNALAQHFSASMPSYQYLQHTELEGLHDNASGVTYVPDWQTLLVVVDDPETIIEYNTKGEKQRSIECDGFKDLESICWLSKTTFAIAEEGRMRITLATITPETRFISSKDHPSFQLTPPLSKEYDNKGIEGLAYDAKQNILYAAKEGKPRGIFEISQPMNPDKRAVRPWNSKRILPLPQRDLSGMYFDSEEFGLMIVSDESRNLIAVTPEGQVMTRYTLQKGEATLFPKSVKKAEGIAMGPDRRIFIVGEPNWLFTLTPKKP